MWPTSSQRTYPSLPSYNSETNSSANVSHSPSQLSTFVHFMSFLYQLSPALNQCASINGVFCSCVIFLTLFIFSSDALSTTASARQMARYSGSSTIFNIHSSLLPYHDRWLGTAVSIVKTVLWLPIIGLY